MKNLLNRLLQYHAKLKRKMYTFLYSTSYQSVAFEDGSRKYIYTLGHLYTGGTDDV